ncbi:ABC transporter permease, partial [Streptomyces sp. NPDC058864]
MTTPTTPLVHSAVVPPQVHGADDLASSSDLAAKYGLSVSGARPGLVEYVRQLWSRRHFIAA